MGLRLMVSVCQQTSCTARTHSRILNSRAIVLYDTLLTFSREVECIWKHKWSVTAALFLLNRYSAVVRSILDLFDDATLPLVRPVIYESRQGTYSRRGGPIVIMFTASYIQNLSHSCKPWFIVNSICQISQLLSVAGSSFAFDYWRPII